MTNHLRGLLEEWLNKWEQRCDSGADPDEPPEVTDFWNGVGRVVTDIRQELAALPVRRGEPQEEKMHEEMKDVARVEPPELPDGSLTAERNEPRVSDAERTEPHSKRFVDEVKQRVELGLPVIVRPWELTHESRSPDGEQLTRSAELSHAASNGREKNLHDLGESASVNASQVTEAGSEPADSHLSADAPPPGVKKEKNDLSRGDGLK